VASAEDTTPTVATPARERSPLFSALIGLASLGILLQGVWAGLFIHENHPFRDNWVGVHSIGASVVGALALVAAIVALVQLRHRRDLVVGSVVFFLLLVVEIFLGGLIGGTPGLAAVHIPLALALMGFAVWLPLRAARHG
jgi:heme A synthase